jgi:large subunit ribosomal protein L6
MKKSYKYTTKIEIPEKVTIERKNNFLLFSGPLGKSKLNISKLDKNGFAALSIKEKTLVITSSVEPFFKTLETLLKNRIIGVCQGFLTYLRIVGVGYRATIKQTTLTLKVGYSHDVKYKLPESVRVFLLQPTLVCLFGLEKNQITQIAAKIREIRPPSPYKGKGIRLLQENVIIKQGKQK